MSENNGHGSSGGDADVVLDYHQIVAFKGKTGDRLAHLAEMIFEYAEKIRGLDAAAKEMKEEAATILLKAKVKSVMVGDLRTTAVVGETSHLSRTKLIELGVKTTILDKATTKTGWMTTRVTKKKEKEEGKG